MVNPLFKKLFIPTLTLSAIFSGACLAAQPVAAKNYSFTEVFANKLKRDAEIDDECHHDFFCEKNYYSRLASTSELDKVTKAMNNQILYYTTINPSTMDVNVFFNDRAHYENFRDRLEEGFRLKLKSASLTWLMKNGQYAAEVILNDDVDRLIPNHEVTVDMGDPSELENALYPRLDYYVFTNVNYGTGTYALYDSCLKSDLYHEGMDCRIAFDNSGNVFYAPVEPGYELVFPPDVVETEDNAIPQAPVENDDLLIDNPESQDHDLANNNLGSDSYQADNDLAESIDSYTSPTLVATLVANTSQLPGAPNTGVSTSDLRPTHPSLGNLIGCTALLVILNASFFSLIWWPRRHHQK